MLTFIRPVEGQIIPLKKVNDDVFSRKIISFTGAAGGTVAHVLMMVVSNGERFTLSHNGHDEKHSNPQMIMTLKESV